MTEKRDSTKAFATCLEDIPCAEMMRSLLGRNGIGSLCAEMMQKMSEHHGPAGSPACAEMLRSMMKAFGKEEDHGEDK